MFCNKCGNELKNNVNFCDKCGAKVVSNDTNNAVPASATEREIKKQKRLAEKDLKKRTAEYNKSTSNLEREYNELVIARNREIEHIRKNYWISKAKGAFQFCPAEGKILINNMILPFSAIKGAQLNTVEGERYVTKTSGKTKHRPSIGKAVVGGALFGAPGAVIGAARGKSKTKSVTNTVPVLTCNHIGVEININGFVQEIELFNGCIDKGSRAYIKKMTEANDLLSILMQLANTPIPQTILPIEQYPSVIEIDARIQNVLFQMNMLKNNPPS